MTESSKSVPDVMLFRGLPGTGVYTTSPFVIKLEARLRFGNLAYRTDVGSISQSPRGKVPYVSITRADGQVQKLSDSTLIPRDLIESGDLEDLNAKLSATEKLNDLALTALLEEKLYFYQGFERWVQNYYTMRKTILGSLPWLMQVIVGNIVYRKQIRTLHGQGTLRFTAEEISAFQEEIWAKLNGLLEAARAQRREREGPFWVWATDGPADADAALFGFIVSALICDAGPDTRELVKGYPVILEYARRIHDRYFPDYEAF